MRTVELLPDERSEATVRRAWRRLADAGLPSLAHHRHPTNRPHLTVVEGDRLSADALPGLAAMVVPALPLDFVVAAVAVFANRGQVLHLGVTPAPGLVTLHGAVWEDLRRRDAGPRQHLAPGRWVPHITLATRLTRAQLAEAAAIAAELLPLEGTWTAARSYDDTTRAVTALAYP